MISLSAETIMSRTRRLARHRGSPPPLRIQLKSKFFANQITALYHRPADASHAASRPTADRSPTSSPWTGSREETFVTTAARIRCSATEVSVKTPLIYYFTYDE